MERIKLPLGQIQTNCYIIHNDNEILIFDPGADYETIIEVLQKFDKKVVGVVLTHTHFDHIGAVDAICSTYEVPLYVSDKEKYWLTDTEKNGSEKFKGYGLPVITAQTKPEIIQTGMKNIGTFTFEVRATPGHSPGSLSFIFDTFAIVGDTLFKEGIGRTDLYEGNTQELLNSIEQQLLSLTDDIVICPGHGPETTVQYEIDNNPFLNGF